MASGSAAAASLGAPFANLANITSALLPKLPLLPPGLQSYLDSSVDTVSTALASSSSYIESATGIPPTALYGTVAGAVILGAAARTVAGRNSGASSSANANESADASNKVSRSKKRKAAKKTKKEIDDDTAAAAAAAAPPPPPVKENTATNKKGKGKNSKKNAKKNSKNGKDDKETEEMRRFGWSGQQPALSPFSSNLGQDGVPVIHDEDYDYITSADLHNNSHYGQRSPSSAAGASDFRTTSNAMYGADDDDDITGIPREDVLLLRRGNTTEKEYFPAYSIGDGKLYVRDVRERVEMLYKLEEDEMLEVRLRYKGNLLDDDNQPICRYGVKNNSELTISLPGDEPEIAYTQHAPISNAKSGKNRPRSPKAAGGPSASTGNLEVPRGRRDKQGDGSSRAHSVASGASAASGATSLSANIAKIASTAPPKSIPGTPSEKLDVIAKHYAVSLLPLCDEFLAHPPADSKTRTDDYRKISETTFQHVLLRLDEVDTGGDPNIRARRKALVNEVQEKLRLMDLKVKAK